jgi:hypothetical protein
LIRARKREKAKGGGKEIDRKAMGGQRRPEEVKEVKGGQRRPKEPREAAVRGSSQKE